MPAEHDNADQDAGAPASSAAQPGASSAAQPGASPAAQPGASPAAQPGASSAAQPGASPAAQPGASPAAQPGASPADRGFWMRTGMPRWIPRLLLLILVTYAVGSWALVQVGHLGFFIRILVYSLFVSFALEPAVDWLEEHGWRRGLGTGFVMLIALVAGVAIVAGIVPLVRAEATHLVDQLPGWIVRVDPSLRRWFGVTISENGAYSVTSFLEGRMSGWTDNIAVSMLGIAKGVASLLFEVLTIGLFSYYLVADAPRVRRGVCSLFRPRWQQAILQGWEISIKKMGGFLYSRLLLGVIIGLATYLVLRILGVPYAAPLALWLAFFAEFIPNVGTYIGAALPLVVCALERSLVQLIALLVFILVYQQFENYVLSPRISAHTMQLHPAVAFGAAIVGGSLFGIMGAFLAVPVAAIIQAVVSTYVNRYELIDSDLLRDHDPDTPD